MPLFHSHASHSAARPPASTRTALLVAAAVVASAVTPARAKLVTWNNTVPRLDSTGQIMDAHDNSLRKYPAVDPDGYYWLHSISYGACKEPPGMGCDQVGKPPCGFQPNHTVNIWKSKDLSSGSWEYQGVALAPDQRPAGVVFRPSAIWNPNTNKVVLYINWVNPQGVYEGYAAFTSPSPAGPFTMQSTVVPLPINNATSHCGDYQLFIDDDGTPYIITSCNHFMFVAELNPDMLSGTGRYVQFTDQYFVEAPAMFKRGDTYYAAFSWCCCYCLQGSGVIIHTAPHPLGPWTPQGPDLACVPAAAAEAAAGAGNASEWATRGAAAAAAGAAVVGDYEAAWRTGGAGLGAEPTPGQGCQRNDTSTTSSLRAQQSFIVQVDTPSGPAWIWTGDRWQQSWDGTKGHDPQTWVPLEFDAAGNVLPLRWLDSFSTDITVAE